ncbi:MAG: hypothetical protein J6X48_08185 [Lachnospiraceae bacterium]|nr:hypothetical protein [Lachnospiraceae bacterium]
MRDLLVIKEKLKKFVGKNEVFILPVLKFLMVFIAMSKINSSLGFMSKLSNGGITLIVALAGSFLPLNLTLVILALIITAHMYKLSMECAILVIALFVIMFLLYFRFASKDSVGALLVPISFAFKVPYIMPVSMGLVGGPCSMVSVGCGTVIYQVLHYIAVNAENIKGGGGDKITEKLGSLKAIVDGMLENKAIIVYAVAFSITVLVVYIIRRLSINYSWFIAIAAGSIGCFVLVLITTAALHAQVSLGGAFFGMIISIIVNLILQYFLFDLDYNRSERVQFEDDEYYYYVKAVPKNTIKLGGTAEPIRRARPEHVREAVRRPAPTRVAREEEATPVQARARETVRTTAANAAKTAARRPASKGPLGMSGGRPAGEGRKKD